MLDFVITVNQKKDEIKKNKMENFINDDLVGFDNWLTSRMYVRLLFWCTHDFGHAYVDMYTYFFSKIFQNFQNLSYSNNFILFKNLLLYI